jgi:hypothetical protein
MRISRLPFPKAGTRGRLVIKSFGRPIILDQANSVVFEMAAYSAAHGELVAGLGTDFGAVSRLVTAPASTSADRLFVSAESPALTIAGSPANDELVFFRLARAPAHASDTFPNRAEIYGVRLFYTLSAGTDA